MNRIKKYAVSILLLLLLGFSDFDAVQAQEFNAGFFGGVTASQVDGDLYGGYHKLGLTGGFFVNRELDMDIFWQMEIKYVSRGAYENFEPVSPGYDKTIYRYIEIPLSVHYLFEEQVQVELGISPEVLFHYASFDGYGQTDPSLYPENRRFGLSAFTGIHYWFVPNASVGLRFTYSAISFREREEWNNPQLRGHFHNVLSLSMAYKFSHR